MSLSEMFGFRGSALAKESGQRTQYVQVQRPLRRVLAFTGRSIDDVVNDPIAKNEVIGYYKLYRQIHRRSEILELERQWNPLRP